jgi:hypothetical protein
VRWREAAVRAEEGGLERGNGHLYITHHMVAARQLYLVALLRAT